jgi:acyl-coenzyme A synthetase/AMP-(fatty) acid ligase
VKIIQRNSNALILHSSGSTSFPKPIFLSHGNLIEWGLQPCKSLSWYSGTYR